MGTQDTATFSTDDDKGVTSIAYSGGKDERYVCTIICMHDCSIASYVVMLLDKEGIEHSQSVKMFLSKPGMQQYLYTLLSTLQLGRVYLDIWVKWVTFSPGHASRRVKLKNPSLRYSLI